MKVKLNWLVIPLAISSFYFDFWREVLVIYAIALAHEGAHVLTARSLGVGVRHVEILPFGVTMQLQKEYIKEPLKEVAITLAGPASNLVFAAIVYSSGSIFGSEKDFLFLANLAMAAVNMVPALPLDGGRALKAWLMMSQSFVQVYNFMLGLTKTLAAIMVAAGAILLFASGLNFSLLLIGVFLAINAISSRREGSLMIMRDLLYSRDKTQDIMPIRAVIAPAGMPARKLIKQFGYNTYTIVSVVDEDAKIIESLTESQIIDNIKTFGQRTKLGLSPSGDALKLG